MTVPKSDVDLPLQMVNERIGKLKVIKGERRRASLVESKNKAGQVVKLGEAALKQAGRRQTWMGPAWMGSSLEQLQVANAGLAYELENYCC